ncbi:hypothetical protein E2C01_075861 [Portunus trituberculatus]|uniref:Uncharacterized protein n=1 Tax=Portunus trituberculatus TaxID=210409 RepID=A0A5B7ILN3_PORTR|nr:hypothetical protein [Portunus trituberculatus]
MRKLGSQLHHQNPTVAPLYCLHHHQTSSNFYIKGNILACVSAHLTPKDETMSLSKRSLKH